MPAKRHRITRGEDFRRIVRKGNRVGGSFCLTHAVLRVPLQNEQDEALARFGFIVSKAVGNAVTRNLVKRRMSTVVDRRLQTGFTGYDVVFRALPAAASSSFAELEQEMNRALDRIERLAVRSE